MNKYTLTLFFAFATAVSAFAQATISPAKPQTKKIVISGATIHIGNGQVIENGFISFDNGKITAIGNNSDVKTNSDAQLINATGKHIYPGFISPVTNLGLV
jgi:imidazolonepropionase-like amidohydrolase